MIEEDICRLIFEDNITINQLNESKTLKKFLKINSNNKIYESNNSIINLIVKNAITVKNYYNNYIKDLIMLNNKFSLYIDEWSSPSLKKYLKCKDFFFLL